MLSATNIYYRVAEATFGLCLPSAGQLADRLPAFAPFRCERPDVADLLFTLGEVDETLFCARRPLLLEEHLSDLGRMCLYREGKGHQVVVLTPSGHAHHLCADARFSKAAVAIHWSDEYADKVLAAMLRIVFSQAILFRGGISLHAAAVSLAGRAYLFMGCSGTGKSTHAVLWQRVFSGCTLLNDDNPTVRFSRGQLVAYGTPWSGKTPCYRNAAYPVAAIVRLRQAGANAFQPQQGVAAFTTVLQGCAVFPAARRLHDKLCDTLVRLVAAVPVVGRLDCLPDEAAARLCAEACGAVAVAASEQAKLRNIPPEAS